MDATHRITNRLHPIIAAATLSLAIAGCGSAAPATGRLGAAGAAKLHADVASIRAAAGAGDQPRALAALHQFSQSVSHDAAQISAGELAVLRQDIAQTQQRIVAEIKPPAATPASATPAATPGTPATPATPAPAPPAKGQGKKDHGGGNGKGKGNGDGGD